MRCNKTGLSDKDWATILDIINVFDPNDIAHVHPEMGTPEFMQDVRSVFKTVLAHVERNKIQKTKGGVTIPQSGPETIKKDHVKSVRNAKVPAVDHMSLAYQQWLHDS
jgi:hypothetical protein